MRPSHPPPPRHDTATPASRLRNAMPRPRNRLATPDAARSSREPPTSTGDSGGSFTSATRPSMVERRQDRDMHEREPKVIRQLLECLFVARARRDARSGTATDGSRPMPRCTRSNARSSAFPRVQTSIALKRTAGIDSRRSELVSLRLSNGILGPAVIHCPTRARLRRARERSPLRS